MFYGLYGGLHLAPFGPLKPEQEKIIGSLKQYHFREIACNHCTGEPAVQKMLELGYPVRSGAGRDGSRSTLYTGNGERVEFPV